MEEIGKISGFHSIWEKGVLLSIDEKGGSLAGIAEKNSLHSEIHDRHQWESHSRAGKKVSDRVDERKGDEKGGEDTF